MIKFLKELSYKFETVILMMASDSIFARSFNRHEQKKLRCGAFISFFAMAITICTVFNPYLGQLYLENTANPNFRNLSNYRSQVYEMNGDIRIHGKSSTIFIASIQQQNRIYNITTKPYARQDERALENVRSFKITDQPLEDKIIPHCTRNFTAPAIVFSTRGFAGNHFHDFTDVLIPLYLTSRQFNGTVLFLVTGKLYWWISKYETILDKLSNYEVIDIDNENGTLCFPRMIVGLIAHKELSIDPSQYPHYLPTDFTEFLRSTYSLDRKVLNISKSVAHNRRPRLLMLSRKRNRHITNEAAVVHLARNMGFDVDVGDTGYNEYRVAKFVNSFDVIIGVHGAGFTNMVFLPENAVAILVDPFGLDFFSKICFGIPAKDMKLRFLHYKVSLDESSLLGKYPGDIHVKEWIGFYSTYLSNQDVNLDLGRFRKTLLKALELLNS